MFIQEGIKNMFRSERNILYYTIILKKEKGNYVTISGFIKLCLVYWWMEAGIIENEKVIKNLVGLITDTDKKLGVEIN